MSASSYYASKPLLINGYSYEMFGIMFGSNSTISSFPKVNSEYIEVLASSDFAIGSTFSLVLQKVQINIKVVGIVPNKTEYFISGIEGSPYIGLTSLLNTVEKDKSYIFPLYSEIINKVPSLALNKSAYVRFQKDVFQIKHLKKRKIKKLSWGERQRCAIVRALIKKPKVLFLDEPSSALDNTNSEILMKFLLELINKTGLTCVICTHDENLFKYSNNTISLDK